MSAVLAILMIGGALWLMKGRIQSARAASRQSAGKTPKAPRSTLLGHWLDGRSARYSALLDDWKEERRQGRKSGTHTAPPAPPRQTVRGKVVTGQEPPDSAPPRGAAAAAPQGRQSPPPGASTFPGPAAAVPPQAPTSPKQPSSPAGPDPAPIPQPPSGGTVSTGAVEQAIEGVHGIDASARAGNIHAKRAAVKAFIELAIRFSQTMSMLSTALSEPGSNYGPEITEPIAKAAEFQKASALSLGEGDAGLTSLMNMTFAELAESARQAPDKSELSETGSS